MKFETLTPLMAEFCGETVTIAEIYNKGYHIAELAGFYWHDDMFKDSTD